jgi:predicted transcriptional regulator
MAIDLEPDALAELCFRRVPTDVVPRDVILAALWHLYVKAAALDLPIDGDRTFRHTLLGKRSGLPASTYRATLRELAGEGLIGEARNGYCLTRRGFAAVREIVDTEHSIELAKVAKRRAA